MISPLQCRLTHHLVWYVHFLSYSAVSCIKAYERATTSIRVRGEQDRLLLAVISPHNPLSSFSIARWIKKSLTKVGLDKTYTAHSTRSAPTTAAAMAGISMKEIMNRAGWSREDTLSKFY